ncbi:hypothetical protein [Burkholderia sp. Ax-1724]|uniref:hypothetical protein n=1 Tax=Burkholderia sp. Ax-1724 TaxID=2608336 RepID=UPI001422A7AE|nr:hypothetical protein [Burkholderia sp. Ax-1724]NIF53854.1 hypothetical protein [Burkholderia sp. Ax-1724]
MNELKKCSKCAALLPLPEFGSNGPGKLRTACKACEKKRDKARYVSPPSVWFGPPKPPGYKLKPRKPILFGPPRPAYIRKTTRRGAMKHPLYGRWRSAKERCHNPNCRSFTDYGGRGIIMFEPWRNDFWRYADDIEREIGPPPTRRHQIDRCDNDKGYALGNVRWATPRENTRNTRATVPIEFGGERHKLRELAECYGTDALIVRERMKAGWSASEALLIDKGWKRVPRG